MLLLLLRLMKASLSGDVSLEAPAATPLPAALLPSLSRLFSGFASPPSSQLESRRKLTFFFCFLSLLLFCLSLPFCRFRGVCCRCLAAPLLCSSPEKPVNMLAPPIPDVMSRSNLASSLLNVLLLGFITCCLFDGPCNVCIQLFI